MPETVCRFVYSSGIISYSIMHNINHNINNYNLGLKALCMHAPRSLNAAYESPPEMWLTRRLIERENHVCTEDTKT